MENFKVRIKGFSTPREVRFIHERAFIEIGEVTRDASTSLHRVASFMKAYPEGYYTCLEDKYASTGKTVWGGIIIPPNSTKEEVVAQLETTFNIVIT